MKLIFRIVLIGFCLVVLVVSADLSRRAVGFNDSNLDESVRVGSNGGVYIAGGAPK